MRKFKYLGFVVMGPLLHSQKSLLGWVVHRILVSASVPMGLIGSLNLFGLGWGIGSVVDFLDEAR